MQDTQRRDDDDRARSLPGEELCGLGAVEARALLEAGEVSPAELVEAAIARIEALDGLVNALPIRRFEAALAEARKAPRRDPQDAAPGTAGRGWLAGLPIAVKDYNDVAGSRTTLGSPIFADQVAERSDLTVARLQRRGAIVLAKSNVPEFAGANTFNRVFGATRNPWNPALTAGGSSGGSAAALSAGLVWLATGNDLGGSLRIPASYCSVVGLRPSVGRVPRPQSPVPFDPLWVEGPMGRSVADVALMLDAEAHVDPRDPLSLPAPERPFLESAQRPAAPARVGFSPDLGLGRVDPEVAALCEAAALRFAEAGATVESACPDLAGALESFHTLRANLVAAVRGPLLDGHREQICPEIVWNIEKGLQQDGRAMARAERLRGGLYQRVAAFFETYDLLACPTVAVPPFPVEERFPTEIAGQPLESYIDWMYLTFALTLTGCPALSLPAGFTADGRPVGLQLLGRPRGEAGLLAAAALLEGLLDLGRPLPSGLVGAGLAGAA